MGRKKKKNVGRSKQTIKVIPHQEIVEAAPLNKTEDIAPTKEADEGDDVEQMVVCKQNLKNFPLDSALLRHVGKQVSQGIKLISRGTNGNCGSIGPSEKSILCNSEEDAKEQSRSENEEMGLEMEEVSFLPGLPHYHPKGFVPWTIITWVTPKDVVKDIHDPESGYCLWEGEPGFEAK